MTNDVSPQVMLAFLNDAWESAAQAANTLRQQFVIKQVAALNLTSSGSVSSVGKNSTSQAYTPYGPATLNHVQIVECWGNLMGLYDQLRSKLVCLFEANADFDYAVPANYDFDTPIFEQMTKLFTALSSGTAQVLPDISRLRLPPNTILNHEITTW